MGEKLNVYFALKAISSTIFLCDFLVIFLVGTGDPPHVATNPNKITVLYGCGVGFKKLGLGQNPNFYRKLVLNASLYVDQKKAATTIDADATHVYKAKV